MSKEEMINKMIKKYGFEDIYTLYFCAVCEDCSLDAATAVFKCLY